MFCLFVDCVLFYYFESGIKHHQQTNKTLSVESGVKHHQQTNKTLTGESGIKHHQTNKQNINC
jgi:hypothetical protein